MSGHRHAKGLHVAIIMDGNGRWARARGLPRVAGHREGRRSVRQVVEACPDLGISTLTLFAFSADNWKRPPGEVSTLMDLFERHLVQNRDRCVEHSVRISVIGRRDRLDPGLVRAIDEAEAATAEGDKLHLRIAVDYSSREAIRRAARATPTSRVPTMLEFERLIAGATHAAESAPEVDLLIRTGGEQRLSDFLLWEAAYAELYFTQRMWPEFRGQDLTAAVEEFRGRERRFGGLVTPQAGLKSQQSR